MMNASSPIEGVVTAGQPKEEELARLAEAGFETVVDLPMNEEGRGFVEPEAVRAAGREYANIPLISQQIHRPRCPPPSTHAPITRSRYSVTKWLMKRRQEAALSGAARWKTPFFDASSTA